MYNKPLAFVICAYKDNESHKIKHLEHVDWRDIWSQESRVGNNDIE